MPTGVLWQGAVVDTAESAYPAEVIATDDLFVGAVNHVRRKTTDDDDLSIRPWVYTSADGLSWTGIPLPSTGDVTSVIDVAHGPAGYVAVGTVGQGCVVSCPRGHSVAWVSPDAGSWELITPATFQGSVRVSVREVEVVGETYLAVGTDERNGDHWVVVVWSSADGREWQRVATLEGGPYSLHKPSLHLVGGQLVIAAERAVCSKPFTNGDIGWVLGPWAAETLVWTSGDGAQWDPVDTEAAGLTAPLAENICDDQAYLDPQAASLSAGEVFTVGDRLLWKRNDGFIAMWDLRAGSSTPIGSDLPEDFDRFALLSVGDSYRLLAVQGLPTGVVGFEIMASNDLASWTDWTGYSTRLVGVVPRGTMATAPRSMAFAPIAQRGETLLILLTGASPESGTTTGDSQGVYSVMSDPGTAVAGCLPGAYTICAGAQLAGADLRNIDLMSAHLSRAALSGADLRDADLTGADLTGADLSGADLSGADLSQATLDFADLAGTNLAGATLAHASLGFIDFDTTTNLSGAELTGASSVPLDLASRPGLVLTDASFGYWLGDALDLSNLDLSGASLGGDLSGFSFAGSNLTNARFRMVDLVGTDFTGANLAGADLQGADLTGALMANARLGGAHWAGATCPDGAVVGYSDDETCEGHFIDA